MSRPGVLSGARPLTLTSVQTSTTETPVKRNHPDFLRGCNGRKRDVSKSAARDKDVESVQRAASNLKPRTPNQTYEANAGIESFQRAAAQLRSL